MSNLKTGPTKSTKSPGAAKNLSGAAAIPPAAPLDLQALRTKLGPANAPFRGRTFRVLSVEALVAEGTRTDSQNILDDMPKFIAEALAILAGLTPARAKLVRLPSAIFPLLVEESLRLEEAKASHDATADDQAGSKAAHEVELRKQMREDINLRDGVYDGLRNALGAERLTALDAVIGVADMPENLAKGLAAVADFIAGVHKNGSADDRASLDDYDVGAACETMLRARAAALKEAGKVKPAPVRQVSQRALDEQDGRVLHLVETILRAFRSARRGDASLLVPRLNKIAWIFEIRSSHKKPAAPPPDAAPKPGP